MLFRSIKIVTHQPKLNELEGSAQLIASCTDGGGGSRTAHAMVNLPLGDVVALRLVGTDICFPQRRG